MEHKRKEQIKNLYALDDAATDGVYAIPATEEELEEMRDFFKKIKEAKKKDVKEC